MSSLGSSLFSGLSSSNNILQSIGLGGGGDGGAASESTIVDPSSCLIALDSAKSVIADQNAQLSRQKTDVKYLKKNVPELSQKLDAINQQIQQQTIAKNSGVINTNIPTFYISLAILVLLFFLGSIYNQLVTKNILTILEENGILDALAKAFKRGDFNVEMDGEEKPFSDYWTFVVNSVLRTVTRGRFVLLIAIFAFMVAFNLFLYTIVFRGNDVINAIKIISVIMAVILVLTFLVVNNQTMNNPFEHVIGYQVVRGKNLTNLVTHIFQHKFFEKQTTFPGANLYYDFIVNTMNLKNYPTVLEEIYRNSDKYDFKINMDPEKGISKGHIMDLYKTIITKNSIGHLCWMFFGSLVGTIISLKYLFAAGLA